MMTARDGASPPRHRSCYPSEYPCAVDWQARAVSDARITMACPRSRRVDGSWKQLRLRRRRM